MPDRHIARERFVYRTREDDEDGMTFDWPTPMLKVLGPPQQARELARRIAEAMNEGRV